MRVASGAGGWLAVGPSETEQASVMTKMAVPKTRIVRRFNRDMDASK